MREAESARSNLAEDLSRLRMELEKVTSLQFACCASRLHVNTNAVDCLTSKLTFELKGSVLMFVSPHSMQHVDVRRLKMNLQTLRRAHCRHGAGFSRA